MWEGWESPKTWRVLAGKQALGGHPSRRQCSARTPQGPQQGCLTGVPALGRLGTPSAHHLYTQRRDVQEPVTPKTQKAISQRLSFLIYIFQKQTYEDLHRGQRVILPVHVLCLVLRWTLLGARADGIELVPLLDQLLGGWVWHLERLAGKRPVQAERTQDHWSEGNGRDEGRKYKTMLT